MCSLMWTIPPLGYVHRFTSAIDGWHQLVQALAGGCQGVLQDHHLLSCDIQCLALRNELPQDSIDG